jgi:hypothetical protein
LLLATTYLVFIVASAMKGSVDILHGRERSCSASGFVCAIIVEFTKFGCLFPVYFFENDPPKSVYALASSEAARFCAFFTTLWHHMSDLTK